MRPSTPARARAVGSSRYVGKAYARPPLEGSDIVLSQGPAVRFTVQEGKGRDHRDRSSPYRIWYRSVDTTNIEEAPVRSQRLGSADKTEHYHQQAGHDGFKPSAASGTLPTAMEPSDSQCEAGRCLNWAAGELPKPSTLILARQGIAGPQLDLRSTALSTALGRTNRGLCV